MAVAKLAGSHLDTHLVKLGVGLGIEVNEVELYLLLIT
jgi:hypothetical protein